MFSDRFRNGVAILLAMGWFIAPPHGTAQPSSDSLFVVARSGDGTELWSHLPKKKLKTARGETGNTLLHEAALYGQAEVVEALLKCGLVVDATNHYGATPLIYGAGDLEVARTLIKYGADVNARSDLENTPLIVAASRQGAKDCVALLLRNGADINVRNKRHANALQRASAVGAIECVRLLLAFGAEVHPENMENQGSGNANQALTLNTAARAGHPKIAELLLEYGADPSLKNVRDMTPLSWALAGNHLQVAKVLLDHGAEAQFTAGAGDIPSMMWAAYDEAGRAEIAALLLRQGGSVNQKNERGETALNWAEKRGPTALRELLIRHGAEKGVQTFKPKDTPDRIVPEEPSAKRSAIVQDSVDRALTLLQESSDAFIQKRNCVSCHQQTIPAVALGRAREKGFPLINERIEELIEASFDAWKGAQRKAYEMEVPEPDPAYNLGYGLWGMHALDQAPNEITKAFVFYLSRLQQPEGIFPRLHFVSRPPMEGSPIFNTVLAMHGMQLYPIQGKEKEINHQVDKGAQWLARQQPTNATDRAFQLLGLGWTDTHPEKRADTAAAIRAHQRSDGGWSQLPGLRSDAWATGLSLLALHEGYGLKTDHNAYRRGVEFLLRTQFRDGSWWVESRSWPFQRHFDSKFPHGKDQWISAPATAWAAMALMATLEGYDPDLKEHLPPNRGYGQTESPSEANEGYAGKAEEVSPPSENITFEENVLPLFERSCTECHSGDDPKRELRVTSKEALLEGGQSDEPALVPGKPGKSKILRLVTDQVEDMEMPPLNKRDNFQRLSPKEVGLIRAWIQLGAP